MTTTTIQNAIYSTLGNLALYKRKINPTKIFNREVYSIKSSIISLIDIKSNNTNKINTNDCEVIKIPITCGKNNDGEIKVRFTNKPSYINMKNSIDLR